VGVGYGRRRGQPASQPASSIWLWLVLAIGYTPPLAVLLLLLAFFSTYSSSLAGAAHHHHHASVVEGSRFPTITITRASYID
jgi:hypothetical protein